MKKYGSIFLSIFLSIIIGLYILYPSSFYIHEGGHFIFGYIDNFINGTIANITVSNWVEISYLPFWKLPQQTIIIEGKSSAFFVLGGFLFTVFVISIIGIYFYNKTKLIGYLLFPFLFLLHEYFGNFLCGTDNLYAIPSLICEQNNFINYFLGSFPFLIIIPIFAVLYSPLSKRISNYFIINKIKSPMKSNHKSL